MQAIRSLMHRHPMLMFIGLAYLFSWWPALLGSDGLVPHGVALAALVVVGLGEGKAGVKAWWGRVIHHSGGWRWYAVAAAIPLVITLTAAGLNVLLGAQLPAQIDWTIPLQVLPIMLLVSGMWEEPGWTGYALPQLYTRFGATTAGTWIAILLMALIRMGWHLPLMLSGHIYWTDLVLIIAVQLVIAWLFNATGGSVLAVMLLHLLNNTISGEFVQQWFSGADWVRQSWLLAGVWSLFALGVLLVAGTKLGRKATATEQTQGQVTPRQA
jgi:hypothetical protein